MTTSGTPVMMPTGAMGNDWEDVMGTVVLFRNHARTSAGDRAARVVSVSAVRPAFRARDVERIGSHHSAGMLSRCGHLRAAATEAPMSAAKSSGESQSATTSLNVVIGMSDCIGQMVLNCKPILSHDYERVPSDNCLMGKNAGNSEYRDAFTTRVYSARERVGLTQEEMAHLLGTTQTTYSKYETRSLLPHRNIWSFCLACKVSVEWLVTGQGKGVALLSKPPAAKRRGRKKDKQRAA